MLYNNIEKLRKILVEELSKVEIEKPILLPFEQDLLQKLIFDDDCLAISLGSVVQNIDFSNISFDGYDLQTSTNNFEGFAGVKINPQTILNKNLSYSTFSGVEFVGSFDDIWITGVSFKGSKGAKINPQTVFNKDLTEINFKDVEFIGSFENASIYDSNFEGSIGAKINPQTICGKDLGNAECADVEFIGNFDGVCIKGTNFKGSKGAKINPQNIYEKDLSNTVCADVEFIGGFENVDIYNASFEGSNYDEIVEFEHFFRKKIKSLILKNSNNK